jgi:hypothetical protein
VWRDFTVRCVSVELKRIESKGHRWLLCLEVKASWLYLNELRTKEKKKTKQNRDKNVLERSQRLLTKT